MAIDKSESQLDYQQVLRGAFSDTNKALRTLPTGGSLVPEEFDRIEYAAPDTVTEVWTYKSGGSGGTIVATVTITFTDASKETISAIQKA